MNIYQRVNAVRRSIGYIRKDKAVSTGGGSYLAVTHDAVTALLHNALVENGIIVTVYLVSSAMKDTGSTTAKGVSFMRYEGTYDISFVNEEDPADRIVSRIESHAIDNGDKAPGKAISYAVKYAMLKLFSLETGEDEEGRAEMIAPKKETNKPTAGAIERITDNLRLDLIIQTSEAIKERYAAEDIHGAYEAYIEIVDADEKVALWSLLPDSKLRKALKDHDSLVRKRDRELAQQQAIAKLNG